MSPMRFNGCCWVTEEEHAEGIHNGDCPYHDERCQAPFCKAMRRERNQRQGASRAEDTPDAF